MSEEERSINGGQEAREHYASRLEAERLKAAADRVVNPREVKEYKLLQHISFPFDKEPEPDAKALQPATAAAVGVASVAQKFSILAGVNAAFVQVGLPIIATVLIGGGVALGVVSVVNNIAVQNQVTNYANEAKDSGQSNGDAPFVASTDPKEPVKVEIPDLSITADTTKVDVNSKGNVGSPANIKQLAWYQNSSSPVESKGTALIVGHVGSPTYAGALADLYKIKNDSKIKLTMGDGHIFNYKVTKVEDISADKIEMAKYLPTENQTTKNLVFITCSGDYNARTYSYSDRLIVTADAIDG